MSSSIFPTSKSGIFIPGLWRFPSEALTKEYADQNYLRFPLGQGKETLPGLAVTGLANFPYIIALDDMYLRDTGASSAFNTKENSGGSNNCFFGRGAGSASVGGTTGSQNTAVGFFNSLNSCTSGSNNSAFGSGCLSSILTTSNNTGFGYNSGTNSIGSNNTFFGSLADATSTAANNSTAIGYNAKTTASNQIVLGTTTETVVIPNQIQFSYASNPTISTTSLGYSIQYAVPSGAIGSVKTIGSFTNVALGIYMWSCSFTNFDVAASTRNDLAVNTATNITQLSGSSLECGGNSLGKMPITVVFWFRVTSTTNQLTINYTAVNAPVGQLNGGNSILVRIA